MMPIRVLVVDDSAFVRKTISAILGRSPNLLVVGFAGDGKEALEQVRQLRPDVVTVDLEMPILNGVQFIEEQMRAAPLPIVVVSSVDAGGELAVASMRAGAVEFVHKPTRLAHQRLGEIETELLEKVHAVAGISADQLLARAEMNVPDIALPPGTPRAVVVGLSTGGPQLLHFMLPRLPADFSLPIALVIHMPVGFTGPLAERLNASSPIEILEARPGLAMRAGRCIIGQAGQHLSLTTAGAGGPVRVKLGLEPSGGSYRPSVDVLFQTASECYGDGLLGFVLTGMGHEGREGSAWIKANGGRVFTQTQSSSVVWGMPRSVFESGLSDGELSPHEIVPFLLKLASQPGGD